MMGKFDVTAMPWLRERLRSAIKEAGGNKVVSQKSGVPISTLNSYLALEADPKLTKLMAIADACGVTLDELTQPEPSQSPVSRTHPELVYLPRLDIQVSAGTGAIAPYETIETKDFFAFQREWLYRLGINPNQSKILEAAGDSMFPTIGDGDLMLVDLRFERLTNEGIYIVVLNNSLLVKRAQFSGDGTVSLISDNPRYDKIVVRLDREDLKVVGMVRWVFCRP